MTVVKQEWQRCRPWIEAALDYCHGTHTIEDVEAGLVAGQYTFWPGLRSAIITEVWQYPRQRFLHIPYAGGELDELRTMVKRLLYPYAFLMGCSRITLTGRRGWERALKTDGWQADMVCLGLPVNGAIHEQVAADHAKHESNQQHSGVVDAVFPAGGATGGEPAAILALQRA
jgi:hypothetical protein